MNLYMVSSEIGKEFAFNAETREEARRLVNKWATRHSQCGSAYAIEDITGQETTLLHNEYIC